MKDSLAPGQQEARSAARATGTQPLRLHTATRKIAAEESGFNAAFYLHVERGPACPACGGYGVTGARFKTPGKFHERWIDWFLGLLNRHLEAELSGVEPALPYDPPPGGRAAPGPRSAPMTPEGLAELTRRHNALRAALGLAVPRLALTIVEMVDGASLHRGGALVLGSCEPATAVAIQPDFAALMAACDALGEPLPREVAEILPALREDPDTDSAADIPPGSDDSKTEPGDR